MSVAGVPADAVPAGGLDEHESAGEELGSECRSRVLMLTAAASIDDLQLPLNTHRVKEIELMSSARKPTVFTRAARRSRLAKLLEAVEDEI
jgi:hypothetical protein